MRRLASDVFDLQSRPIAKEEARGLHTRGVVAASEPPDAPVRAMPWETYTASASAELRLLLDSGAAEQAMQDWLERNPAFVPGAGGPPGYGHHGPLHGAVVTQPPLRGLGVRVPDFLCLTKTSGVLQPVLVEIEAPRKNWFTAAGRPTAELTEAQDQLREWREWLEIPANRQVFLDFYRVPARLRRALAFQPSYWLVYGTAPVPRCRQAGLRAVPPQRFHRSSR